MNEGDGRFSIAEFSTLTGLPEELLRKKINGTALGQAFFSIQELAARWRCSRATVYNRLRAEGAKVATIVRRMVAVSSDYSAFPGRDAATRYANTDTTAARQESVSDP